MSDTENHLNAFRLLALKGALKLESKGRTAAEVLPKFEQVLRDMGILVM